MTDSVTLQKWLTEAENAYHQLMMGSKAIVLVDSNGERIEYQRAESAKLSAYIAELKRQLGQSAVIGPARVTFC